MAVFRVVLDSCVLYPMYLRDTLLRASEAGLYQIYWSQEILNGALNNLVKNLQISPQQANKLEQALKSAFPEAMVEFAQQLIPCMDNATEDRHVLATALIAKASVIVTNNLKDFSPTSLEKFRTEAQSPDQFLTYLYDLFPQYLYQIIENQSQDLKKPPRSSLELINLLAKSSPTFADRVKNHRQNL